MATPTSVDVEVGGQDSGSSFNLAAQLDCGAGSNRFVTLEVCVPSGTGVTATCGGTGMTLHDSADNTGGTKVLVFKLANPTSGLNTVTITPDHNGAAAARARSFSGVDPVTPIGTAAKQTANTASPSVAVDSATDDYVCDALGYAYGGQTPTPGAGQTEDTFANSPAFDMRLRGSHETATGVSTTMSWTMTSAGEITLVGYALKGVGPIVVAPSPVGAVGATVNPIVIQSSLVIVPTPANAVAGRAGPQVLPEGIIPTAVNAIGATVNPTVVQSSMTVAPAAVNAVAATVDPTVGIISGQIVTPLPATAVGATINPTVAIGGVGVTPAPATAVSSTINPTIQLGSMNVIPSPLSSVGASAFSFYLGGYVNLAWDSSAGATGYKVYYGTASGVYTGIGATEGNSPIDVGNVTTFTLHNLISNQNWYFAVTAYNAQGESGFSNELVVFVTTGLFVAPAALSMVSSAVDPTIRLGSISITPAVVNGVAATQNPSVLAGGSISVNPAAVDMVGATLAPSVRQSSMTIGNLVSSGVGASVNPSVVIGGGLTIVPNAVEAFGTVGEPNVILGSISILVDNIPQIANVIGATANPSVTFGSTSVLPAVASAVGASVGPDIIAFGSFIFTPTPATAIGESLNPNTIGGLPAPTAALTDAPGMSVDRYGFRF